MTRTVDVYFVRHAESMENVKMHGLREAIRRLKKFQLPTLEQVTKSVQLVLQMMELDAELSILGDRQLIDMRAILEENSVS